jgi:hypothetical protein
VTTRMKAVARRQDPLQERAMKAKAKRKPATTYELAEVGRRRMGGGRHKAAVGKGRELPS